MSQSLTKALILLKHLGASPKGAGVRELGRLGKFTPSTVHALLKALQAQGFVSYDEATRQYRLGLAMAVLGAAVDQVASMREVIAPVVEDLFAELGESIAAVAWLDGRPLVVGWKQSAHQLVTAPPAGEVTHPHRWASGQVLLAYQPAAVVEAYIAGKLPGWSAKLRPAEATALRSALAAIRERRHAEVVNLNSSGVVAIGIPVPDALGEVRLAIAVSAPMSRLPADRRRKALPILHAAAARIAPTLGAAA
ncbi:MAG: IclR family transcriptional regulator [Planctomycetota bacterium]|mgnify:CR=1 FL=1